MKGSGVMIISWRRPYIHMLRPLCWTGLLDEHRIGKALEQREVYTKTPLWAATLKLETDRHLREPTRH